MQLLEEIRLKIEKNRFEFSRHAVDQSILRDISVQEVREVVLGKSKIIERYPEDKYGPSCLVFGHTLKSRPIHIQCSYPSRDILKIITLYEPDPEKWINYEIRQQ